MGATESFERSALASDVGTTIAGPAESRPDTAAGRLNRARQLIILAAGISFVFSVALWFLADREQGLFVGLWVPSILSFGSLMLSGRGEAR